MWFRKFADSKDVSLFNYRGDIPVILLYQVITKFILLFFLKIFNELHGIILWNDDKPAFSTGKIPELMSSWQGIVVFLLGLISLIIFTIFDINTTIIMSDRLLHRKKINLLSLLKDTFESSLHFFTPVGILVSVYAAVIGPLFGAPLGIAITTNLSVPEKIIALIFDDKVNRILYCGMLAVMLILGFYFLFVFQYAILGKMRIIRAMRESRIVMIENWRDIFHRLGTFILRAALILTFIVGVFYLIPISILHRVTEKGYWYYFGIVFFTTLSFVAVVIYAMIFFYFWNMKLTMIYESYTEEDEGEYLYPEPRKRRFVYSLITTAIGLVVAFSVVTSMDFDKYFPAVYSTNIIAHRGGGYLGNENTVLSLEEAAKHHIKSAEIDVQRTNDGWYVINHDSTFNRCCGVKKKVSECTLDEILDMKVRNNFNPGKPDTDVATLDEIVEAAKKYNIHLYVELKGDTADRQMADEVYHIIDTYDYINGCTFISMNFDTIYHLETEHPDAVTGYLCFYSYGTVRNMKCDALLLRTDAAIQTNVKVAHANGKKVYVWTVNTVNGLTNFITSDVDGIITDEVELAQGTIDVLKERNDEARVLQKFITEWRESNRNR